MSYYKEQDPLVSGCEQVNPLMFGHDYRTRPLSLAQCSSSLEAAGFSSESSVNSSLNKTPIPLSPSYERIIFSHTPFFHYTQDQPVYIDKRNQLKYFDASFDTIKELRAPLYGLHCLQYLDLTTNNLQYIAPVVLKEFPMLTFLNASGNNLDRSLKDDLQAEMFAANNYLEVLDISECRITLLAESIFKNNSNLTYLDVSANALKEWYPRLNQASKLTHLNMSFNQLRYLSRNITDDLDFLTSLNSLVLDLTGNELQCNCMTLEFLRWLQLTNVTLANGNTYKCSLANRSHSIIAHVDLDAFERQCEQPAKRKDDLSIILAASAGAFILLTSVLTVLVYRFHWKLEALLYKLRRKLRERDINRDRLVEDQMDPDVFLFFHEADREWCMEVLAPRLEGLGHVISTENDCEGGRSAVGFLLDSIMNSRRVIPVISTTSCTDSWCSFAFDQMVTGHMTCRGRLVPIIIDDLGIHAERGGVRHLQALAVFHLRWEQYFWENVESALLDEAPHDEPRVVIN